MQKIVYDYNSSVPLDLPPENGPVAVREFYRAEGPERILSEVAETSQCGSYHLQVVSCGCRSWQGEESF